MSTTHPAPPTASQSATAVNPTAGTTTSAVIDPADLVAAAVLAAPGVVRLHGGRFGEVATYLPRRRVVGVRLRPDTTTDPAHTGTIISSVTRVEVHVVARYPATVTEIDTAVRAAVRTALAGYPEPFTVAISVEDIVADHPAIGGPIGDHPVTDTVEPEIVEPEIVEQSPVERAEETLELPAPIHPAEPAAGDHPVVEQLLERVVTERTVNQDGVTDRVTIEHTVIVPGSSDTDTGSDPT